MKKTDICANLIPYEQIPLFDGIKEEELNQLLYCMKGYNHSFSKGEIIILEQEKVQYIGIVLSGIVNMIKEDIWGEQTLLTYMNKGELFGENFAVQKSSNSAVTFIASTKVEVLFLPASNIIHVCPKNCSFHARLTQNMFNLLGQKSVSLINKIEICSKPTIREKILAYLSLIAQNQRSRYITVPTNRSQMAEYLGVNRSAMTRELSKMQQEGIIDFDKNTFTIKK